MQQKFLILLCLAMLLGACGKMSPLSAHEGSGYRHSYPQDTENN